MILGFNIGNTNTVMGIYDEDNPEPIYTFTYPTRQKIQSNELSNIINDTLKQWDKHLASSITGAIYSSVVPQSNTTYNKTIEKLFTVTVHSITHLSKMPIGIEYDNPAQLGVDRIVNAVAAFTDYACDCIIVDIGTAITFCQLKQGVLRGGIIAPGVRAAMKGLAQSTAQLFEVPFEKPPRIIATNTNDALISGFFYGWIALIEGIISKIQSTMGTCMVIVTGGMAEILYPHLSISAIIDHSLTMRGIFYLYNNNR